MGPKSATKSKSKHGLFIEESSSVDESVIVIGSSSSSSSSADRNKRHKNNGSNGDEDCEPEDTSMMTAGEPLDHKYKKPADCDMDWQSQIQDASPIDLIGSSTDSNMDKKVADDAMKSVEPDEDYYMSDNSYEGDYYEDDDVDYEYDFADADDKIASKFDDMDLPPGVEATVPWLEKPILEKTSNYVPLEDDIDKIFNSLKQFDTVADYSDHHFAKQTIVKHSKEWSKKIGQDWKLLENDLPETIYVRVYEERMDLLRAVIVGPAGTPYHDGLFFFDFLFPPDYPHCPPKAHYHSGGLRLNPNLYACGKVCLSLLNTWQGKGCEKWNSQNSTMLQVLVSIQALVLNEKPYFNEPGYEASAKSVAGQKNALAYNENTFLLSCRTMLYSLRRPPLHFKDFVAGHFRRRGHTILVACRAYLDNLLVGSDVETAQNADSGEGCSKNFKAQLKQLFEDLLMEFTVKGADCKEFLSQKAKVGDATALPKADD